MTRFTKMAVVLAVLFFVSLPVVSSAVTVTNLNDSGPGSLRQAIIDTPPGGTVDFTVAGTIFLVSELVLDKGVTIDGPGADQLIVSGGETTRVINITSPDDVEINGIRISDGFTNTNDTATNFGPAIYISSPATAALLTVELNDCIVDNNKTTGDTVGLGVINIGRSLTTLVINRCDLFDNSVTPAAGKISLGGVLGSATALATIEVNHSTFRNNLNQSEGGQAYGGVAGLAASGLNYTFNNCTFDSNRNISIDGGAVGGVLGDGAALNDIKFINSTFYNNENICMGEDCSFATGGAIGSAASSTISCDFCTFAKNKNTCSETDCTIPALNGGDNIGNLGDALITISNSIIYGETPSESCLGPITSLGYNLDNGMTCIDGTETGDKINTDPMLDPAGLQDNGGPTETIALLPGSMAIHMADPASTLTEDQRLAPRPFGLASDIGAYEFGAVPPGFELPLEPIFPGIKNNVNMMTASQATAEGKVAFVWGFSLGTFTVGGATCNGIELGISPLQIVGIVTADDEGTAELTFFVPQLGDIALVFTQAVDLSTCRVSDVIENILLNN